MPNYLDSRGNTISAAEALLLQWNGHAVTNLNGTPVTLDESALVVQPPPVQNTSSAGNSPPLTGSTLADLGDGTFDGQLGVIRIGTWPNQHQEVLTWDDTNSRWVGEQMTVITQSDTWSLDLLDKVDLTAWGWIVNPNPNSTGVTSQLNGAQNLNSGAFGGGTGVLTLVDTTDFASSGAVICRGNRINYTGKSGATLTGCTTVNVGLTGNVPSGASVTQGDSGGWGMIPSPIPFAGEMFAAGFTLQEKMVGFFCGSLDSKALTIAPYWYEFDSGDGSIDPESPPSGGLGFSASLVGTTTPGGTIGHERQFKWAENSWADWAPGGTPTKRFLVPRLFGQMASGATDSGQVVDATLRVRWVS